MVLIFFLSIDSKIKANKLPSNLIIEKKLDIFWLMFITCFYPILKKKKILREELLFYIKYWFI